MKKIKINYKFIKIISFSVVCIFFMGLTACNKIKSEQRAQDKNRIAAGEQTKDNNTREENLYNTGEEQNLERQEEVLNQEETWEENIEVDNLDSAREVLINPQGLVLKDRFLPPKGYNRVSSQEDSFGAYLQRLPLKEDGAKVKYYDGREKLREVYLGVVDFSLGERDLQQCADAVIRLRAEYLYEIGEFHKIQFHFVNGFLADFSKWSQGYGIGVSGNNVTWKANAANNGSYESFEKYLDMVYAYASTLSLEKELTKKQIEDLAIGDVFIQGGSPGHCVIVVDLAVEEETGDKIFILAQSYMPAQDIQILKGDKEGSPWVSIKDTEILKTPEWTFDTTDLKTW